MKKVLKYIFKKQFLIIFSILIFIALNVYLLTFPSKILGQIIDYLYDIEKNKILIINSIKFLIIISIFAMITRVIWKRLIAITTRFLEKTLRDKLFENFLKINYLVSKILKMVK